MKRIVLVNGVISGIIVATLMVIGSIFCYSSQNYDIGMVVGYSSMLLAFSLVFVGIKTYRDKYLGGSISFGKAFMTGLYIALIASSFYVVTWLVEYYVFIPDFMDKYCSHAIEKAKAAGATADELSRQMRQMDQYKEMYKSPIGVILLTYMEVLPVGLLVTLVSALIIKRKPK